MPAVPASRLVVGPHCRMEKAITVRGVGRALSAAKLDIARPGLFRDEWLRLTRAPKGV